MEFDISDFTVRQRFRFYGLDASDISFRFGISRPTLYRYFDLYADGEYAKVKKPVRDFFDFLMGSDITDSKIDDYLENNLPRREKKILPIDVPVADFSSEYMDAMDCFKLLSPGTTLPDGSKVPEMPSDLDPSEVKSIMCALDSRSRINDVVREFVSDSYSSDNFYYSSKNHAFVSTFKPIRGEGTRNDYYQLLIYLSMVFNILSDDKVLHCPLDKVRTLKDKVFEAIQYIDYLRENVDDFSNSKNLSKIIDTLNRPTFDIHSFIGWYVRAYIEIKGRTEDDLEGTVNCSLVKATSHADARVVSGLGFGAMLCEDYIFGPFDSKRDAEFVQNFLQTDWSIKFAEDQSDPMKQHDWLEELSFKQELRGENW